MTTGFALAKKTNKRPDVSDQVRRLVETCGISRYEIAKRTGIDDSALCRFVSGERGISCESLDKLGRLLELEVVRHAKLES